MATKKAKQSSTDEYAKFVQKLRLNGLGMDGASASLNRNDLAQAVQNSKELTLRLELTEKIISLQEGSFTVGVDFELSQSVDGSDDPLVRIGGSFSALFVYEGLAKRELVGRFASAEAKLIFWPYVRQYISDISARMSIHSILLPLTSELSKEVQSSPAL